MLTIAPYRDQDCEGLLRVWERALPIDAVARERFEAQVLLDPNFDARGLLVARTKDDGPPVGFALCLRHRVPVEKMGVLPGQGFVTAFAVDPDRWRQGIGTALLAAAEGYLRDAGCQRVAIAPYTTGYFVPGVDKAIYASGLAFLLKRGFKETSEAIAMDAPIGCFELSDALKRRERELAAEGLAIRPFSRARMLEYLDFMRSHMPGPWIEQARANLAALVAGRFPEYAIQLACHGDEIIGYCQFEGEHFGPFGICDAWQGKGIGTVLLARTLWQMRKVGLHAAFVLWTGERAANGVYARLGFTVSRRFALLAKSIVPVASQSCLILA